MNFRILDSNLWGLPIIIVSTKDNGDQRRTHRKKRINKKWRKRYGTVSAPFEKGKCVIVPGVGVYMSMKTLNSIRRQIKGADIRKEQDDQTD